MNRSTIKKLLLSYGYLDNLYLDKYLDIIFNNLSTKKDIGTQSHHIIPVINYWNSAEPYNRQATLKIARQDLNNKEINLLYADHLLAHAYLTLCSDLAKAQRKYISQAEQRHINASKTLKAEKTIKQAEIAKAKEQVELKEQFKQKKLSAKKQQNSQKYRTIVKKVANGQTTRQVSWERILHFVESYHNKLNSKDMSIILKVPEEAINDAKDQLKI